MDKKQVDIGVLGTLITLKNAYENRRFIAEQDCALSTLFQHGMLYRSILRHAPLSIPGILSKIAEYQQILHSVFPPDTASLSLGDITLELGKSNGQSGTHRLSSEMLQAADKLFRSVMLDMLAIFQCTIFEVSAKLQNEPGLSAEDIENAQYVVGMAEITANNLGHVLEYKMNANKSAFKSIQNFFVDMTKFASALRVNGYGTAPAAA